MTQQRYFLYIAATTSVTGADPSSRGRTGRRYLSYNEELKSMPVSKEMHMPRETRAFSF